jgi:sugar lactone lactonase YvrE
MGLSLLLNPPCLLGESPLWNPLDNSIYFIDIKKPAINRFCIDSGAFQSFITPSEIGCIVLKEDGDLLAAMQDGLAYVSLDSQNYTFFASIDNDQPNNRPNDGKCDEYGRLWIASMDNNEVSPSGKLWKISSSTPEIMDKNFVIGNGIDWSPDSKKMYFTDSISRTIFVYDFNLVDGTIANKKVFVQVSDSDGFPDGLTVDSQGFIWSAHWDGWRVTRYNPNGLVDMIIELPIPRPTSIAFGGTDLSSLFITSASIGLSSEEFANAPLSGGLFVYKSVISGRPSNMFSKK